MKSKDVIFDEILGKEGGYVNHPDDKGGPTKWGVTEKVARAHGYRGDMRDLTRGQALEILEADYWYGPRFDQVSALSPDIAAELCDTGVNMGPSVATKMLQRWLNVFNQGGKLYPDMLICSITLSRSCCQLMRRKPGKPQMKLPSCWRTRPGCQALNVWRMDLLTR